MGVRSVGVGGMGVDMGGMGVDSDMRLFSHLLGVSGMDGHGDMAESGTGGDIGSDASCAGGASDLSEDRMGGSGELLAARWATERRAYNRSICEFVETLLEHPMRHDIPKAVANWNY